MEYGKTISKLQNSNLVKGITVGKGFHMYKLLEKWMWYRSLLGLLNIHISQIAKRINQIIGDIFI